MHFKEMYRLTMGGKNFPRWGQNVMGEVVYDYVYCFLIHF